MRGTTKPNLKAEDIIVSLCTPLNLEVFIGFSCGMLSDLFRLRDNIKNLRGVKMLQVPKPNTTRYGKNSVKYLVAITWNGNKISVNLRSLSSLSVFKKAVRQLRF